MESSRRRVLVVANRTAATPDLLDAVKRYARDQPTSFALLIPDAPKGEATDWTLELALPLLQRAAGGPVEGLTGMSGDPFDAVRKVVSEDGYDRIIIRTLPRRVSKWLRRDLPKRVEALGVPVEVVTAAGRGGWDELLRPPRRRPDGRLNALPRTRTECRMARRTTFSCTWAGRRSLPGALASPQRDNARPA